MDLEEVLEEEELDEEAENPDIRTDENGIKKIQYELNDVLKLRIEDKNQVIFSELVKFFGKKKPRAITPVDVTMYKKYVVENYANSNAISII